MHFLVFLFFISGCSIFFGGKGKAPSAKDSIYTINFSRENWMKKRDERSDFVYEHKDDGKILLSNSFCGEFQNEPLENLALKTFRTVSVNKDQKGSYSTFHNREAYRIEGMALVDGVEVELKLLNTRRDSCYFDFVSIAPAKSIQKPSTDFESFLEAVEFK